MCVTAWFQRVRYVFVASRHIIRTKKYSEKTVSTAMINICMVYTDTRIEMHKFSYAVVAHMVATSARETMEWMKGILGYQIKKNPTPTIDIGF